MSSLLTFCVYFASLVGQIEECSMPQPTKEQINLINNLGSDTYTVRESAQKDLAKMERNAILAIERHGLTNSDLEIKKRSKQLHDLFYAIHDNNNNDPNINGLFKIPEFTLPSKQKFQTPIGTPKYFYLKAGGTFSYDNYETNSVAALEATKLYTKQLLRVGYSRNDIRHILDHVEKNSTKWSVYDLYFHESQLSERRSYYR